MSGVVGEPKTRAIPVLGTLKRALPESWLLVLVIIAMSAFIGVLSPVFFSLENIINIIISISVIGIVGIGMTMVMLLGDIDVSVGGILALSAAVAGSLLQKQQLPIIVPILAALAIGTGCGAFNGFCRAMLRIPALIVTLATVSLTRGLVLIYTKAQASYGFPKSFLVLGQGSWFHIPIVVYLTIFLLVIAVFVLNRTTFGRSVYAIGNNAVAARICGVRVNAIRIIAFSITGFLCALAGLTVIARMDAAAAMLAQGLEFQIITAVVIGGTSIAGGRGSIGKTIIGAVIVGLITNGLQLLNVSIYYSQFISGLILLIAVALDVLRRRKQPE